MQIQKKITATILILTFGTIALIGAVAYPTVKSILTLRDDFKSKRLEIEERYLRRQQINKALAALVDAKKQALEINAVAVKDGRELEFVSALETAAGTAGVEQRIQLVTANQKDISKWEKEIPITLFATGTYPKILDYINAVERLPYYIVISRINIGSSRRAGSENPSGTVEAKIDGTVYWQSKSAPDFLNETQ